MKHTNTNEFNAKVKSYLLPIIEQKLEDYETETSNPFAWVVAQARSEVPHEFARKSEQDALAYWLSGMALNIDCYYSNIITTCEEWHGCKLNEKEREMVCERWFSFVALKILQFSRKN